MKIIVTSDQINVQIENYCHKRSNQSPHWKLLSQKVKLKSGLKIVVTSDQIKVQIENSYQIKVQIENYWHIRSNQSPDWKSLSHQIRSKSRLWIDNCKKDVYTIHSQKVKMTLNLEILNVICLGFKFIDLIFRWYRSYDPWHRDGKSVGNSTDANFLPKK